jgi:steroid 5-alpha reductase family enzyme
MWWGIWLMSVSIDMGYVTVYSCLFITFFLRFVSGVPFPEKKYEANEEWQ